MAKSLTTATKWPPRVVRADGFLSFNEGRTPVNFTIRWRVSKYTPRFIYIYLFGLRMCSLKKG